MIKPPPMVELWSTHGITGRIGADGSIVEALDEDEVRAAVDRLIADGVESVTIGFLNSYVNPEHERRAREIAHALHRELPISISSETRSATEDLVYLLDGEGVETGVELDALLSVSDWLRGIMKHDVPSLLSRAGPFVAVGADS